MKKTPLLYIAAALLCLFIASSAQLQDDLSTDTCSGITTESLGIENLTITSAELVTGDTQFPAYCLVRGTVNARTGIDERDYAINLEMRLPLAWNGRFLYQMNGGNDGAVVPAIGGSNATGPSGLIRGFAVLSTDSGHNGNDPANLPTGLVAGNRFGLDPQARADYGYATTETMTPIANTIIAEYYGEEPEYSYMMGCSNGGRHGMVTASRFGDDYDGILVGSPGFNLPRAAVQHAWDVQSFQIANPDMRQAYSRADMSLVAQSVVNTCDALDGLEDGIVNNLTSCQQSFDLSALTCEAEKTDTCLTAEQVAGLEQSMGGPVNSAGEQLYSDWPYDAGMGSGDWRFWKLESPIPPWDNYPLIATLGGGSLSYIFTTPPTETAGDPASLVAFLTEFDFDTDAPKIFATDETFTESAMEFMTPPDVDNPTLTDFYNAGGKMIIYHGQSDAVFSANDTINWYEKLSGNYDGDAGAFVRLFMVPGMNHCAGGPSTDQFDALSALITWVEAGQAPDSLTAAVSPANAELPEDWSPTRTRPLCPWPMIATYQEGGDPESAASFTCEAP